jgi:hypothetical protein
MEWIKNAANRLPITASSNLSELADFTVTPSTSLEKDFWEKRSKIPNFLKHADRDPKSYISMDDVDNKELLMYAFSSYADMTRDRLYPEGDVFWVYFTVTMGMLEDMPDEFKHYASMLKDLDHDAQVKFCMEWLSINLD